MKKAILLTTILLSMLIFSAVSQAMTMNQLVLIPTADMISGNVYFQGEINRDNDTALEGIYKVHPKLQIGGIGVLKEGDSNPDFGLSAKTSLVAESQYQPAVAAGVQMKDIYLVMSKSFNYGIRAHLGVGNGDLDGVFIGVNKVFNPVQIESAQTDGPTIPTINLMGEYVNSKLNIGMRVDIQNNIALDFALVDFEDLQLGLGFNF